MCIQLTLDSLQLSCRRYQLRCSGHPLALGCCHFCCLRRPLEGADCCHMHGSWCSLEGRRHQVHLPGLKQKLHLAQCAAACPQTYNEIIKVRVNGQNPAMAWYHNSHDVIMIIPCIACEIPCMVFRCEKTIDGWANRAYANMLSTALC